MFKSQYQIAKAIRKLPKSFFTYKGDLDLSKESVQNWTKDFILIENPTDENTVTYTGMYAFGGLDYSLIGQTAYTKHARPIKFGLYYPKKLPTYVEEDLMDSTYLQQKVKEMKIREQEFIERNEIYRGWDNFMIIFTFKNYFNNVSNN
jgi:hypothetical protein